MFALHTYAPAHPRLAALTWGGEDLAAALGATENRERTAAGPSPIRLRARNACSRPRAAGRHRRSTRSTPTSATREGLERDCRRSRRDGFLGRMAIHPDQVETINRCYTPSEAEIAHARRIVEAFAANPGAGTLGHRRQDDRHPASEGGAKDAGVDLNGGERQS